MPHIPKTWKAYERRIARLFGVEREKNRAMDFGQEEVDFKTPIFAGQCKFNRKLPNWAKKDIEKALKLYPDKISVVIFTEKGTGQDWIVLNLKDFLEIKNSLI